MLTKSAVILAAFAAFAVAPAALAATSDVASLVVTQVAPGAPAPVTVAVNPDNQFLANASALDAAVRLATPGAWHGDAATGLAGGAAATSQTVTLRYRLNPQAGVTAYVAGALAGPHSGPDVSLNFHNGAAVAFGLTSDPNSRSKMSFDVGVKQALFSVPGSNLMPGRKTPNPLTVGAGFGMKF